MPDAEKNEDDYLCSAFRVKDWIGQEPVYIRKFKVEATDDMLHHMIIHACDDSMNREPGKVWYFFKARTHVRSRFQFKISFIVLAEPYIREALRG